MKIICDYCGSVVDTDNISPDESGLRRCPVCSGELSGNEKAADSSASGPIDGVLGETNGDEIVDETPEYHTSKDTRNYKCPSCGSPIEYAPGTNQLGCSSCGNVYPIETLNTLTDSDENAGFSWSDYNRAFKEKSETLAKSALYMCRYCGAGIETDGTTAATRCPFCDNDVILTDKLEGSLRPNAIIPFKIKNENLRELVNKKFSDKKLLPDDFFEKSKIDTVKGVYIPFWLFGAKVDGTVAFNGTTAVTTSDANYIYTTTTHYLVEADGSVDFKGVPVDASSKADNELMNSLEPYDYSELKDFNDAYLSGYVADRFDKTPDNSAGEAQKRMTDTSVSLFMAAAAQKMPGLSLRSSKLSAKNADVKYALLPAYILNANYEGKNYRIAINGQTGKIVGELPVSKKKKRSYFWRDLLITLGIVVAAAFVIHVLRG